MLRASRDAGVKRVVLTSSFAAIGYGQKQRDEPFTERDWTNPNCDGVLPYTRSKILAEHAAWDFMAAEGGDLELSVINPVGVFGPVLGPDYSASILIVQRMMDGAMPGCPRLYFGIVDVRDVADLHIRAMTHPAAKGETDCALLSNALFLSKSVTLNRRSANARATQHPCNPPPNTATRIATTSPQ